MTSASGPATDMSADGGEPSQYGCTVKEFKELMSLRGHEGYQKLQDDYRPGGVFEICRRLQTSPVEGRSHSLGRGRWAL
jgi:hypothetical protein